MQAGVEALRPGRGVGGVVRRVRPEVGLAVGESSVMLIAPPCSSLLKNLIEAQGGAIR